MNKRVTTFLFVLAVLVLLPLSPSNAASQTGGICSKAGKTNTFAINWLLNNNARVMLNYSETKFETAFTPVDTTGSTINSERTISLRTQVNF